MRLRRHFIALSAIALSAIALSAIVLSTLGLALLPAVAASQRISWVRYEVPESGAVVDLPTSIFTEAAGKPEAGYGARFLTSDRRADLTVQSVTNDAGLSPAVFLA